MFDGSQGAVWVRLAGRLGLAAWWIAAGATPILGQGRTDYLNVESPQGSPILVARVGNYDYLVAVNTRNGTVEIFDTDEAADPRLLAVVKVGLEPVSVQFNPRLSQLFTANFLGDSVSVIALAAPSGPASLSARLLHTTWVGDEPIDLAFYLLEEPNGTRETLFVTHMSPDGFGWRDAVTFAPVRPGFEMVPAAVTLDLDTSVPPDGIPDTSVELAAKEPRGVLVRGDQLLILPLKGYPNSLAPANGDLDLWCDDVATPGTPPVHLGGLHTTGLAMTFDAAGNLYLVGGEARNEELADEPNVAAAATGFVKSMFYLVQNPCSASPTVLRRDVNLELATLQPASFAAFEALPAQPLTKPVPKAKALSMLTAVAAFETGGPLPKVFFTAFGNDRVGIIVPDPSQTNPNLWAIRRIAIPSVNGNPLAGPNGLAVKAADGEKPARVYVLDHLDNSIIAIDPVAETVVAGASLSLSHDPRPAYLTQGQQFLYNAKLSGKGFVSCASCHVFGRTDRLAWDLGTPGQPPVPIPTILPDAVDDTEFPADKGLMITQSLQGLLNFELPQDQLFWTTNAPYHWRGDRARFLNFNPAFASLLGGQELSEPDMLAYEAFINSIHYPGNPKQPRGRRPSGDFGQGENLASDGSSGAFRGLKIFHVTGTVGASSCARCHALMEGSNNRITENSGGQPIETAALRGLFQKEGKRDLDGSSDPSLSAYTGLHGLIHTGLVPGSTVELLNLTASINAFNQLFFTGSVCGSGNPFCPDLQDLNQFVHEMDWGVGPLVGCPATVALLTAPQALPGNPTSAGCARACTHLPSTLDCMERQADRANSALAVQAWIGGAARGFWFDPVAGLYREEPAGGASLDRTALVGLLAGDADRLVFQAVPLGNERRTAAPSGASSGPLPGPAPANVQLLPMTANDFYDRVPELQGAWASLNNAGLQSIFLHTVRLYQWGLILEAPAENGFGLGTELRHDAPRRFQVAGDNLRHGALLAIAYHNDPNAGPPDPSQPLSQVQVGLITMPLYPTADGDPLTGRPIWQTAVELEPLLYYALMLGGPFAPGVAAAYLDQKPFTFPMVDPALDKPTPGQFAPVPWDWLYVFVLNADGSLGDGGWQRLRIQ